MKDPGILVYRFQVTQRDDHELIRIIDINADATFEDLHLSILSSINFDNAQLASFYLSDKNWRKGEEITVVDMGGDEVMLVMSDYKLNDLLKNKGDRLIYVYDFVLLWTFKVELIEILKGNPELEYPYLIDEKGKAPDQYGDKSRYPEKLSSEDQIIIDMMKDHDMDFNIDFDDEDD